MTIPVMMSPTAPWAAVTPSTVLSFPLEGLLSFALPVLAAIAVGVVTVALLRARRHARPAPVPSSVPA